MFIPKCFPLNIFSFAKLKGQEKKSVSPVASYIYDNAESRKILRQDSRQSRDTVPLNNWRSLSKYTVGDQHKFFQKTIISMIRRLECTQCLYIFV